MKKSTVLAKVKFPTTTKGDAILVHPLTPPPPPVKPTKSISSNNEQLPSNGKK